MTTLTQTDLGASGRYVNFGDPASLRNLGAQTILAYVRPSTPQESNLGYVYSKFSAAGGQRFCIGNDGSNNLYLTFGSGSSGSAAAPNRPSTPGTLAASTWVHAACTWDGGLGYAGIHLFLGAGADLAETTSYGTGADGSGSITPDTGYNAYVLNRNTTNRAFVGDGAYVAVWNRVLTLAQLINAQNNGPLAESSGLVLLYANGADLGPGALSISGRSTYVAGAMPPNTALGTAGADASASGATLTGTSSISAGAASGNADGTAPGATLTGSSSMSAGTATGTSITVEDNFERSSINVSGSSVSGSGDAAVITLKPRSQASEVASEVAKWVHPCARVTGVNGFHPHFKFSDYGNGPGQYWQYPWASTRRPMYSYDFITWQYFDNLQVNASDVEFWNTAAFTSGAVYIAAGRCVTVTQIGTWLSGLAASYPSLIGHVPSNTSGYVSGTYSAQTDELGRTVAAQPFYAFRISDASLTPTDGNPKRHMCLTCGVHAGEDMQHWMLDAAVQFLCGGSAQAQNVRRNFDITVYPMMNPMGRTGGHFRGSFQNGVAGADDLNRHFNDLGCGLETVTIPRAAMALDLPEVVQVSIDYHSEWVDNREIYADGNSALLSFKSYLEAYIGATTDYGTLPAACVAKWFQGAHGTKHYVSLEVGDLTPVTDAYLTTYGQASMQVVSDLLNAGEILPAIAHGATLSGSSTLSAGAGSGNAAATAPGATLAGASSLTPGSASGTGSSTAPGASLAGAGSIAPGAPAAGSTGPGATLAGSSSIAPGSAAGDGTVIAPGASLSGASALVAGSASNGITVIAARRRRSVQTSARRPAQY